MCHYVTRGKVQAGLLLLALGPVHLGVPAALRSSCRPGREPSLLSTKLACERVQAASGQVLSCLYWREPKLEETFLLKLLLTGRGLAEHGPADAAAQPCQARHFLFNPSMQCSRP